MRTVESRGRLDRISLVTAGISAVGGVIGGACAALTVAIVAMIEGGITALSAAGTPTLLAVASGFGAVVGMIGAPMLSWALLRRVALGRAIAYTALGTVVGAVVGELTVAFVSYPRLFPGVIAGALVGYLSAGAALHLQARRGTAGITDKAV